MKHILNAGDLALTLDRLASEIWERHHARKNLMIVGIERRGADLARRLAALIEARKGAPVPLGTLDINLYRDDWTSLEAKPHIGQSHIPSSVDGKTIVLVDDVLFTGRTIRSALSALLDYGRPRLVELLVLIDRGHRELPIQADYVGQKITTSRNERVDVYLTERNGKDDVVCGEVQGE